MPREMLSHHVKQSQKLCLLIGDWYIRNHEMENHTGGIEMGVRRTLCSGDEQIEKLRIGFIEKWQNEFNHPLIVIAEQITENRGMATVPHFNRRLWPNMRPEVSDKTIQLTCVIRLLDQIRKKMARRKVIIALLQNGRDV